MFLGAFHSQRTCGPRREDPRARRQVFQAASWVWSNHKLLFAYMIVAIIDESSRYFEWFKGVSCSLLNRCCGKFPPDAPCQLQQYQTTLRSIATHKSVTILFSDVISSRPIEEYCFNRPNISSSNKFTIQPTTLARQARHTAISDTATPRRRQ